MAETIVGVTVRSGNYENKPWKNLYISTKIDDSTDKGTIGGFFQNYKIQFKILNDALSLGLPENEVYKLEVGAFQKLIGKQVTFCFDKYHNVNYVIIKQDNSITSK